MRTVFCFATLLLLAANLFGGDGFLKGFKQTQPAQASPARSQYAWSGYTNWWNSIYSKQYRYGNLYKVNVPDAEKIFAQSKRDLALDMGLGGLQMQEGFVGELLKGPFATLINPSDEQLRQAFKEGGRVLVLASRDSAIGAALENKGQVQMPAAPSYQMRGGIKNPLNAFVLAKGRQTLMAAVGAQSDLYKFKALIENAISIVNQYDLKRGWFGVRTDIRTVSASGGTPIEVMAAGMNEGNSWFVFAGEYERFIKGELERWISESASGVEAAVGSHSLYDCDNWDGFQEQLLKDNQREYAKERDRRHGYLFRPIQDWGDYAGTGTDIYDGYFASEGNAEIIDTCSMPFVLNTGSLDEGALNSMILFTPKGEPFSRKAMWGAIMDRRAVAMEKADTYTLMGPENLRRAVQMLILDREWLENYFGDRVSISSCQEGTSLKVCLANMLDRPVKGSFAVTLPPQLAVAGSVPQQLSIPAGGVQELVIPLAVKPEAMGRRSAVTLAFDWGTSRKKVMAEIDLPEGVATHSLLYGNAGGTNFPVSVYNFTDKGEVDVTVAAAHRLAPKTIVWQQSRKVKLATGQSAKLDFDLKLDAGNYIVTASAMGAEATTQLGIGAEEPGSVKLWKEDVNGDGIDEIYMENSRVRVMLLAIGARIMEYYVKDKEDNVFFKNWPNEPYDPDRPYRKRNFWPFGGFEDFLGQASVETHEVYDCEVIKDGGEYAEVRMRADFFGNTIEKVFTLYGDTPLLGIRFALDMVNQEFNMLGPQPILEVGKAHDPQDSIIVPEADGLSDYRVDMNDYWGKFLFPVEGWNVDYDTVEDIYFAGAFPVDRPYTLHMWHNHPRNRDTRFYYCELQPWTELYRGNTTYFSYYMWAGGGSWEQGIQQLRDRNLITTK